MFLDSDLDSVGNNIVVIKKAYVLKKVLYCVIIYF